MKKILIATCLLLSCLCLQAQSKWYIAPELGAAGVEKSTYFYSGLTVGYYPSERPYGLGINGSYVFNSDNNIFTAALLAMGELRDGKWITTGSLGIGMQKISSRDKVDLATIISISPGYQLTENLLFGIKISATLNFIANVHFQQSGVFLAIKF